MKNIVLTGFMASGKTEISKTIAQLYNLRVIDTDALIVEKEGRSINTIFADDGEKYFRDAETEAVVSASYRNGTVIATGGGVVLRKENIELLRKNGLIYYLAPSFDVIAARIENAAKTRPLMKGQTIEQIKERFDSRIKFYENCDFKIDITSDDTPLDIAKRIMKIHKENEDR